jgi:hypothetical protein
MGDTRDGERIQKEKVVCWSSERCVLWGTHTNIVDTTVPSHFHSKYYMQPVQSNPAQSLTHSARTTNTVCETRTVLLIDNVVPDDPKHAVRYQTTAAWRSNSRGDGRARLPLQETGHIWFKGKLHICLSKERDRAHEVMLCDAGLIGR